ncbi:hypothetical protein DD237_004285 [Peronospora effusa]|uniref:Uncharacterized protein n=1 Tax=Peronospora effusa TaxID=542832 RepID=A0A3R7XRH7_9STRA|nr:hypothetical protein DD237_004285 [Peronospora effusa]
MKPRLDHLRAFGSMGYAHTHPDRAKELQVYVPWYKDDTKGYSVYYLELNEVKMLKSVKLDERGTSMTGKTEVIDVIKVIDEVAQPESEKELPVEDEPMESAADPF